MAIFRVGPGRTYTTINSAISAAPGNDDLIVIDPGTYSEDVTVNKWVNLLANTTTPENGDVTVYLSYGGVFNINYLPPDYQSIYIEGIKVTRAHNDWAACFHIGDSNNVLSIYLNKCIISSSYTDEYPINVNYKTINKFYIENCYIQRGYSHVLRATWGNITEGVISKTQTNDAYFCYQCSGSPDTLDTVATPTVGYGPAYGSYYKSAVPPTVSGTADLSAQLEGMYWISAPNIWTQGAYIFQSHPVGVRVYSTTTEDLLGSISYESAKSGSVWANDDYLYIATTNSGVLRSPMSSISGGVYNDLDIYKDYPFIENYVNYIHGAGNYLNIATISGVHIFNTLTDIEVYYDESFVAEKCHQLPDRTAYYIFDDKALTIYNDDLSYMYKSGDGIIPTISGINDLYVVPGTNNLILLATTNGAVVIEERKGDEVNSRFKYYYIEE